MANVMDSVEKLHALADKPSNKNDNIFSDEASDTSDDSSLTPRRLEMSDKAWSPLVRSVISWLSVVVWPLILTLPLLMTSPWSPTSYQRVFQTEWYEYDASSGNTPKPLGLILGILTVAIGQVFVWIVFYAFKYGTDPVSVQTKGAPYYQFMEGLVTHISQPEGFILLGAYLAGTWMCRGIPSAYYSFEGSIQWQLVFLCLVIQDALQYIMHRLEHDLSPLIYKLSHKPHHKFTNPRLFDAFNGSTADTVCMILIPLYATAHLVPHCNVWTYMAFGSLYANWLTLIHSEYAFPWDGLFHRVGFGTPADHHVHHAFFKYNFGHLFMWSDRIGGTYKNPAEFVPKSFNDGV